jgi:hypothetical protein
MPTYQMPLKIFNYHLKGRRDRGRPPMRWMDQFAYPGYQNRPIGLNLVDDDDILASLVKVATTCTFRVTMYTKIHTE